MFSNCLLVDGLLTSIVSIIKHSKRRHSLLQRHLEYVMRTFELERPKVSIFSWVFYAEKRFYIYILIKPVDDTQTHLYKYKTMYKMQICYSTFLDNKLFTLNHELVLPVDCLIFVSCSPWQIV